MPRIKKLIFSLAALVAITVAASTSARADSICIVGGTELTGSGSGTLAANVLTITATNVPGGTRITIDATNLPAGAFVSNIVFNTNGAPTATGTFTVANGRLTNFSGPVNSAGVVVTAGNNTQSQPPFTGFDVEVDLPIAPPGDRLSSGETLSFVIQGITNVDLCLATGSGPGGSFSLVAHIQGLGTGNQLSGRYTCTSCNQTAPVPEPMTMLLLGTGLAGVAGAARRRRRSEK
jgi:hypothetical protein